MDDSLGNFLDFLARRGLDQRALVVLLSDHGESLGDHGESTHGYFIYRSTLHVPLILHWPHVRESRNSQFETRNSPGARSIALQISPSPGYLKRVDAPAGLTDVAPTILSFLGLPAPKSFCGHNLLDLARGGTSPPRDVYSESSYAHDKFGWGTLRSLRRAGYQYIDAPRPELYDLQNDPAELHNLLPGQSAIADAYRERLTALLNMYRSAPHAANIAPGAAENLRSLGYLEITSAGPALDDSGIDPKDRLFEYKRYLLAGHLARIGKAEEAAAEFATIVADDPRNVPALIDLARTDVGLHHYLDATNQLKAALALAPQSVEAEELLGDIWLTVGQTGSATAEFERLLAYAPQDYEAHFGLGLIAARRGQSAEAAAQFRRALAADSHSAEAHYQLGLVLETQKQRAAAANEFKAALNNDPGFQNARRELSKLSGPAR